MANLEGKREVLIDFLVDFIINTKRQLQAAHHLLFIAAYGL